MSTVPQKACWTSEGVLAATPRDAASLQPGHFQAVHHPLRLRRRPLGSRSGGRWVEESEIVGVLEGALRPDGYLLVPVVGGSGTGKSHLVRWVHDHTRDHAGWESRYLAKNRTSIRRVIEIVIEGLEGRAIDAAREALLTAPAQTEQASVLAKRLLDELALITAEDNVSEPDLPDRRAAQMAEKLRRELPDLLHHPIMRRQFTADGAVIPRLVNLALEGRRDGDGLDDDAIRVSEDDLPLTFDEIGSVDEAAGGRLLRMLAVNAEVRSAAVAMINDALPAAVKRVFVSNQVDLIEIFREVRRELHEAGKELVLFIEDLTVLHGVEREFLDAIVEPARSPDGELCALRVLFAVTEGHFDGLDTVRTRCDDAYWLDAGYGPDGVGEDEAISFIARYLNACRLDPHTIEASWQNRHGDAWLGNACMECEHRVSCHEAFGVSNEGYGLFPFNPVAVDRLVSSLSGERFDPRDVVRELINRFLLIAEADLSRGDFPSDTLTGAFDEKSDPLDPLLQADLKSRRPADYQRLVNAMRYWAEEPPAIGDATLEAFGLASVEGLDAPTSPTRQRSPRPGSKRGTRSEPDAEDRSGADDFVSHLPSPWRSIYAELGQWSGSQQSLAAPATRHLKQLVRDVILGNLDFSALPINLGSTFDDQKRFDPFAHVYIEGSVTDQRRDGAMVVIERDADTAAALQGLILLSKADDTDHPRRGRSRRQAARYVEQWTLDVAEKLERNSDPKAEQAVLGLLVSSLVSGACEDASDEYGYLRMLFSVAGGAEISHRSTGWQDVVQEAVSASGRLRPIVEAHFGEARGSSGGTRALRADLILPLIRSFMETWDLHSTDGAIDRFMRKVPGAVAAEWEMLDSMSAGAAPNLDPDRTWTDQTARVVDLVESAHRAGRLSDYSAAGDLATLAKATQELDHRDVLKARRTVEGSPALIERLRVVASPLPDTVSGISRFVQRAVSAMQQIEDDLDRRRTAEAAEETLEDVAAQVLAGVDRLVEAVEVLEK